MDVVEASSFSKLGLSDFLLRAIHDLNYEKPSPVQQKTIPFMLEGRDLIAKSQTGSGKTAAFMLPILERLALSTASPQALILAPTRELALQIEAHVKSLSKHMRGVRVVALCGGQDYQPQLKKLRAGAHVVVGTPGRMLDHIQKGSLKLNQLKTFVLDEADEMLKMGFIEDVETTLSHLPEVRQVVLFSATMPPEIKKIAKTYLSEPETIEIKQKTATVESIEQRFLFASNREKPNALLRVLSVEPHEGVIVFTRTKSGAEEVASFLRSHGQQVMAIHGDITQNLRERAIAQFKAGAANILVATDVAARGLDVERVTHVVNYDMAHDCETYVHRIGRTGRAGRSGISILFVTPKESRMVSVIERHTKQTIQKVQVPTDAMIHAARAKNVMGDINARLDHKHLAQYKTLIQTYLEEHEASAEDVAAALLLQLHRDKPWDLEPIPQRGPKTERPRKERTHGGSNKPRARRDSFQRESYQEERYRLDVGKVHGVKAANIVGAIANEGGLQSRYITGLKIHESHSTVCLPHGMPNDIFRDLKRAFVCGRPLNLTSMGTV